MSTKNCQSCGAPVAMESTECRYCGEKLSLSQPQYATQHEHQQGGVHIAQPQQAPPYSQPYGQPQGQPYNQPYGQSYGQPGYHPHMYRNRKNKVVAGLLAIFLGGFGIHKFYLGRIGWGIVYLLFCWTYIPSVIGFIEGIVYLASNEEKFHMKYSKR